MECVPFGLKDRRSLPIEPQPTQLLELLASHARAHARPVDVLHPHRPAPVLLHGPQPGEQGGAGIGQMELGDEAIQHFQDAALRGDAPALVAQLAGLRLRGRSLAELFDELAAPALHRIGARWAEAKLSVAEEHVGSQAVIDAVARSQPLAEPAGEPVRPDRGTAIVAAVAGELHDIAARMCACLLRAKGFEVLAPLAQTPARDLADLILRSRASMVALSSTMAADIDEQLALSIAATKQTGGGAPVGGGGRRAAPRPARG